MNKGKYIVIEGAQGVGKTTMVRRIAEQLRKSGTPVRVMREPDSQNDLTARTIRQITQSPEYPMNTRTEVLLYNAARSQSLEIIRNLRENGVTCLVDHNYLTTLAIQYYGRGDIQDYQRINDIISFAVGNMEPDLTIVLDAPAATLRERTRYRYAGERFDNLDEAFLERVRAGYLWEAKQRGLSVVYANEDEETVFQYVWQHVSESMSQRNGSAPSDLQSVAEVLAANPPGQAATTEPSVTEMDILSSTSEAEQSTNDNDLSDKDNDAGSEVTTILADTSKPKLDIYVTNTEGPIYSFTGAVPTSIAVASLLKASVTGTSPRTALLDILTDNDSDPAEQLDKVIDRYKDTSYKELGSQYIIVENASCLLSKKLEWGRLASYIKQPLQDAQYDKRDANGHYRFFIPPELKGKLRSQYIRTMNQVFDGYAKLVADLTTHIRASASMPSKNRTAAWRAMTKAQAYRAAQPLLPVAAMTNIGIYASGQAIESMITRLLSDDLPEARVTGKHILSEARKVMPVFLKSVDDPKSGGAITAYRANTFANIKQLAQALLPPNHAAENDTVTLVSYSLHNELDIVADALYEHSDLPLSELQTEIAKWPYQQKVDALTAYIGERLTINQRPGRAFEKVQYSFDLTCDFMTFYDLQKHQIVDDLEYQALSPRLGYAIPTLVEEVGATDVFEQCFDLSLQLYSALQNGNLPLEAQYATLFGHKMRWKVSLNAREAFHLFEISGNPKYAPEAQRLVQQMHSKITEVHPMLAESMHFVKESAAPEQVRLAAERYTEYKIAKLDTIKS